MLCLNPRFTLRQEGSNLQGWRWERFGAQAERADDGDFERVKNPGDPQSDDDQKVKPAPGKPRRNGMLVRTWVENAASAPQNYFRLPLGGGAVEVHRVGSHFARRFGEGRLRPLDSGTQGCATELFVAELAIPGLALRNPAHG
jgi:hypothetical protein